MKLLAAHGLKGDIEHFIVLPDDAPPAAVGGQGQLLTEVATPQALDLKKAEGLEPLIDMAKSYQVDVKGRTLVRKK